MSYQLRTCEYKIHVGIPRRSYNQRRGLRATIDDSHPPDWRPRRLGGSKPPRACMWRFTRFSSSMHPSVTTHSNLPSHLLSYPRYHRFIVEISRDNQYVSISLCATLTTRHGHEHPLALPSYNVPSDRYEVEAQSKSLRTYRLWLAAYIAPQSHVRRHSAQLRSIFSIREWYWFPRISLSNLLVAPSNIWHSIQSIQSLAALGESEWLLSNFLTGCETH